jgi:hypothetical protein
MATREGTGRRRHRSADDWQGLVDRFAVSGLSVAAYCRQESISTANFYRWRGLLGRAGDTGAGVPGFVDLGTLQRQSPSARAAPSCGRLELKLDLGGGMVLHLVRG